MASVAGCFIFVCTALTGCAPTYGKYSHSFTSSFDTLTTVTGYARAESDFNGFAEQIEAELLRMHRLFDIYNDYEDTANLKTVNDNAGIRPVQVDSQILELLEMGAEWYERTGGAVNIALGPVLALWHDSRESALENPDTAKLPDEQELRRAARLCDITKVEIDRLNGTVYLTQPGMRLDVGALAKGYAVQWVSDHADSGKLASFLISAGGNVTVKGTPQDGRDAWAVGIQNPDHPNDPGNLYDILRMTGGSAVTSGDYQRFFTLDGTRYAHIIDPETLYPAVKHRAVTVTGPDGGVADALSTALFVMERQAGLELIEPLGYQAVWID